MHNGCSTGAHCVFLLSPNQLPHAHGSKSLLYLMHTQVDTPGDNRPDLAESNHHVRGSKGASTGVASSPAGANPTTHKTWHDVRQAAMELVARWGTASA
jgi:hypothetical protein